MLRPPLFFCRKMTEMIHYACKNGQTIVNEL